MKVAYIAAILGVIVLVAGCANYYEVKDTGTGKIYYTKEVKSTSGGAVKFEDARTKAAVTVQSSEVRKIEKDEFTVGVYDKSSQK